jgi:hypothetical protein
MTIIDINTRQRWIDQDAADARARAAKVQALSAREERALDAYALGMSYSSIAGLLGVKTAAAAFKIVDKALERRADLIVHQGANKARARMIHQVDLMLSRYMPMALAGDDKAAKVVDDQLKRMERLLGLAAPKKVEHHHEIDIQTVEQRRASIVESLQMFAGRIIEGEIAES